MACYIIAYDLIAAQPSEYEGLYDALKAYRTWGKITETVWAIKTTESAKQVRDNLKQYLGPEDRLFVVRSGTEAAWSRVRCRNQWLKDHL